MSTFNTDIGPFAQVPLHVAERLTPSALYIFVWLVGGYADRRTHEAKPSVELLAEDANVSVKTVRRALDEMERVGVIVKHPTQRKNGARGKNAYTILMVNPVTAKKDENDQAEKDTSDQSLYSCQNHREPEVNTSTTGQDSLGITDTNHPEQEGGSSSKDSARTVFDHWAAVMPHKRAPKFTSDRRRKIEARLAEGYTVEDCIAAIDGCTSSDWHMGRSPYNDLQRGGKLYIGIDLIFRSGGKLEDFRSMGDGPSGPSFDQIREDRMVLDRDEEAERRAERKYPYDEASERTVKAAVGR